MFAKSLHLVVITNYLFPSCFSNWISNYNMLSLLSLSERSSYHFPTSKSIESEKWNPLSVKKERSVNPRLSINVIRSDFETRETTFFMDVWGAFMARSWRIEWQIRRSDHAMGRLELWNGLTSYDMEIARKWIAVREKTREQNVKESRRSSRFQWLIFLASFLPTRSWFWLNSSMALLMDMGKRYLVLTF